MACASACAARTALLGRAQFTRQAIEHTIDIAMTVGAAETLGQFHRFIDDDAVRHFRQIRQFKRRNQQNAAFDRTQLGKLAVEVRLQIGQAWEDANDLTKAGDAYAEAVKLDPGNVRVAARGGIVAVNRPLDAAAACSRENSVPGASRSPWDRDARR